MVIGRRRHECPTILPHNKRSIRRHLASHPLLLRTQGPQLKTITIEQVENGHILTVSERHVFGSANEMLSFMQAVLEDGEVPMIPDGAGVHTGGAQGWPLPVKQQRTPTPPPPNDGFTDYQGGGCPAAGNAIVCVRMHGEEPSDAKLYRAEEVNWEQAIAYKVLPARD